MITSLRKKVVKLSLVLVAFIIVSCKGIFHKDDRLNKIGGNKYVILVFNPNEKYPIFKNSKPANLSEDEIIEIENIAGVKISEIIVNHNMRKKKPDTYVRQYVSVINEKGEKEVWLNIFCNDPSETEWRKGVINVADGGDCAFNLKVNLSTKTYYDLIINLIS